MKPEPFYAPIETYIGRVRIYLGENPKESRVMTESELQARTHFTRLFGKMSFDEDTHDEMFRFVLKNIQHLDPLKAI